MSRLLLHPLAHVVMVSLMFVILVFTVIAIVSTVRDIARARWRLAAPDICPRPECEGVGAGVLTRVRLGDVRESWCPTCGALIRSHGGRMLYVTEGATRPVEGRRA